MRWTSPTVAVPRTRPRPGLRAPLLPALPAPVLAAILLPMLFLPAPVPGAGAAVFAVGEGLPHTAIGEVPW